MRGGDGGPANLVVEKPGVHVIGHNAAGLSFLDRVNLLSAFEGARR
jgi:hypothetical protein